MSSRVHCVSLRALAGGRGQQGRMATGLPSHALADGLAAIGPDDISFHGRPEPFLSGFKTITDIEFDEDNNLLVVEDGGGPVFFAAPGRLLRIAPDGTRTVIINGLDRPTSVAVGSEGEMYVTNHGITPGIGEVLRICR